ncbi:MAG: hypothetical protein CM15mP22_6810 [Gammaproteobacteria bacterium]|nr:MAG: hypothetical protein CM15mP22_6810 [Gammaproteobacteria bacterium]
MKFLKAHDQPPVIFGLDTNEQGMRLGNLGHRLFSTFGVK